MPPAANAPPVPPRSAPPGRRRRGSRAAPPLSMPPPHWPRRRRPARLTPYLVHTGAPRPGPRRRGCCLIDRSTWATDFTPLMIRNAAGPSARLEVRPHPPPPTPITLHSAPKRRAKPPPCQPLLRSRLPRCAPPMRRPRGRRRWAQDPQRRRRRREAPDTPHPAGPSGAGSRRARAGRAGPRPAGARTVPPRAAAAPMCAFAGSGGRTLGIPGRGAPQNRGPRRRGARTGAGPPTPAAAPPAQPVRA